MNADVFVAADPDDDEDLADCFLLRFCFVFFYLLCKTKDCIPFSIKWPGSWATRFAYTLLKVN